MSKGMIKITRSRRPVVLITGASQGIGAALAAAFAREIRGVRLALVATSSPFRWPFCQCYKT